MRFRNVFFLVLVAVTYLSGQEQPSLDNGYKPYGSFDSTSIDSVSNLSGNLVLDVPAPFQYAQRGSLNPRYSFYLTSKNWMVQCIPDGQSPTGLDCQWAPGVSAQCVTPLQNMNGNMMQICAFPSGMGLTHTLNLTLKRTAEKDFTGDGPVFYGASGYSVVSWDLSVHELYAIPGTEDSTGEATQFESTDGTGYHVQMSNPGSGGVMNSAVVTDRAGNQYQGSFPDPSMCVTGFRSPWDGVPMGTMASGTYAPLANGAGGGSSTDYFCGQLATFSTVTDANGNVFNLATGMDTLGRTPPAPPSTTDQTDCVSPLPISNVVLYDYLAPNGTTNQIKFCYANFPIATSFSQPNVQQAQFRADPGLTQTTALGLVATIVLADHSKWTFNYDSYGEVTYVGLPLGGSVSYTWTEIDFANCSNVTAVSRAVASRTVNDNNGHSFVWNYQWGTVSNGTISNTATDSLGNDTVHVFTALDGTGTGACSFYETETRNYQGSGGSRQLLKQVDTTYSSQWITVDDGFFAGKSNIFATGIQTTVYPSGQVSSIQRVADPGLGSSAPIFGEVASEKIYDWGPGAPGALLRETDTTYEWQNDSRYLAANILGLPAAVIAKDAGGNRIAEADYTYDESQYLTTSNISTQHGAAPAAVRGNLTTASRWLNTSSNPVVSHTNWYDTGEVYKSIDPLGNITTHSYDPAYAGAYATQTTNALNQSVSGTYDFNTGLLTSFTDANGKTSNYSYDFLGRMTLAQLPADSSGNRPQTTLAYSPANTFPLSVQRSKTITTSLTDVATNYFDGLGRSYETQHATPNGNATVMTTYDGLDHVVSVTNPYSSTSDPTYGVIQTQVDALGRVTQVTKQDGSISSVHYNGNCATTLDEANKPRRSCSDALGRLVQVEEPSGDAKVVNPTSQMWGMPGDIPVPGDYDGDGKTDYAIWRPSTGEWWIIRSSDGTLQYQVWGVAGDIPVPGDYDGDGKTDIAIWRPSTGAWWIISSSSGTSTTQFWGGSGDTPVPGDYDGDGKTDLAIWRPSSGTWWIWRSSDGAQYNQAWGGNGDIPVPGDYDGDKKTDLAVWRPSSGVWWIWRSSDGGQYNQGWGESGDIPAPGDYDGDKKTDLAVFRPSTTTWWVIRSSDGLSVEVNSNADGTPVAGDYRGDGKTDFAIWQDDGLWWMNLAYITQYSYDALGNLVSVAQEGDPTQPSVWRERTFTYDSLSRLLTALNPESGQISYSYDANGNVLQKTSPAPNQTGSAQQTISYCYDALNRVTGKAYSSQSCPLSTPVVTYTYDGGTNGIGHLTSLTDQAGSGTYSYDPLGRISSEQRTIAGIQKNLSYTYNLDSSIAKLTYPSGAAVTYTPDSAGRILSAIDSGNNINYVTNAAYQADGSITGFVSGASSGFAGITNQWQYNARLQVCRITALTSGTLPSSCTDGSHVGNVLDLGYNLNLGAGDNGNVAGITNYKDTSRSQTFTYDPLNRLISAQNAGTDCTKMTVNGKTEYWGNSYGYDPWGNLLQKTATKCGAENLTVTALYTNQLSGYGYDAAGNMTHDATTGNNYAFDQENRITGAAGYTYTYDADGNRVEKSNGSTGTIYWYMSPGIVAESDLTGALKSEYVFFDGERAARKDFPSGALSYYFPDSLGTASVVADSAGSIKEDEDFYPWGGELAFVNSDSNRYKFGGHERDNETGLDYMLARYYSNPMGRFLTPDWAAKPITVPYANFGNPQSLNLYAYTKNNPRTFGDPDGHCCFWEDLKEIAKGFGKAAVGLVNNVMVTNPRMNRLRQMETGETPLEIRAHDQMAYGPANPQQAAGAGMFNMVATLGPLAIPGTAVTVSATAATVEPEMVAPTLIGFSDAPEIGVAGGVGNEAHSAMNLLNLNKSLAGEAQAAEAGDAIIGAGTNRTLGDAGRLASDYGGNAADWSKMSSSSYQASDGSMVETHWYQNDAINSGKVELKTKIAPN